MSKKKKEFFSEKPVLKQIKILKQDSNEKLMKMKLRITEKS